MSDKKRETITHQFLNAVRLSEEGRLAQLLIPVMLVPGVLYSAAQVLEGDWPEFVVSAFGVVLLLLMAVVRPLQRRILGGEFARHHATTIALFWFYSLFTLRAIRSLADLPAVGKESQIFYITLIIAVALTFRTVQLLFAITERGTSLYIVRNPLWQQVLVVLNDLTATAFLAFVVGNFLAQALQPDVFTTRIDPTYTLGILSVAVIYYGGLQALWFRRWHRWLSHTSVWLALARLIAPFALIVAVLVVVRRFIRLGDPRTADLLGGAALDRTVLALSPIMFIIIGGIVLLVYTSGRGLKERFLPDDLLEHLPRWLGDFCRQLTDMDMLLFIGVLSLALPVQIFLLGGGQIGVIETLQRELIRSGEALIDTSEQALALIFAIPFYIALVGLLVLYGFVVSKRFLTAHDRDDLVDMLPIGLIIILIIMLYLGAIPFSQVLIEGRLPRLPQDLGRILAFYVVIPLLLLYIHYFPLVRLPYGRGQSLWRQDEARRLERALTRIERGIASLDAEIKRLESFWATAKSRMQRSPEETETRFETLFRFVELNGRRDQLNMERLQILRDKQVLAEVNETPVSLTVARLPLRIVSIGIPLLLAVNVYQWIVLNDGLRELANNPNITIVEFFRTILEQAQF